MSCQRTPVESPSALISASLAANLAAIERSGRRASPSSRSASANSRVSSAGVRSAARSNLARSTTSMPMPTIICSSGYSTVTDLARLRGWSTSRPLAAASSIAKMQRGDREHGLEQRRGQRDADDGVGERQHRDVALLGDREDAGTTGADLL